jgi:hypothetical protein
VTNELRWVLERAFAAAPRSPAVEGVNFDEALRLARSLGLDARIGARLRLGAPGALSELTRSSAHAAASVMRARGAAEVVAEIAAAEKTPCCFLKGMALEALGVSATGSRAMSDLDVLVPADAMPELAESLRRRGFVPAGEKYPHQLAPRVHPHLGSVEFHRHVPGVRVAPHGPFARLAELERAGLTVPWPGMPGRALLPVPTFLLAHLLAHALAQHGFSPGAYPPLRLLGDLTDLGVAGAGGEALLEKALPLIGGSVPPREARAAVEVCRVLGSGDVAAAAEDAGDAGAMFRHLVTATVEPGYRASLALQDFRYPLSEGGRLRGRLAAARTALLLSRRQIDAIYGPPRHAWGYAARRALRPLDLIWRAGRALLS